MKEKKTNSKLNIGKLIAIIIIALVAAAIFFPKLLFFLNPHQQSAVQAFADNYLVSYQPLQNAEGGFDLARLWAIILVILVTWAISAIIQFIARKLHFKNRQAETGKTLVTSLLRYAIVIYALIYCLSLMGLNVVGVIASIGVLGLIIGFGAQSLIEDVITGLFVLFEGKIQVGDIVAIDEHRGQVTNVGIRTTTLLCNGNERIINNSDIRNFVNLSSSMSSAVAEIPIPTEADLPTAEKACAEICKSLPEMYPDIFTSEPKFLGVDGFDGDSLKLKVVSDVEESKIYDAQRLLNRELFLALKENGVEVGK